MSDLVPSDQIERIVGVKRHRKVHLGRAISAKQTVYILHSKECLDSGIDLRECRFSLALDLGIELNRWQDMQDRVVMLGVWLDRLIPLPGSVNEGALARYIAGAGVLPDE